MTTYVSRSSVLCVVEETTEGTYVAPTAAGFIPIREGTTMAPAVETITADTLTGSIGAAKSFAIGESGSASIPLYLKHSGTEGTAPEFGILVESCLGDFTDNGTEYDTIAGSTAGTSAARGKVVVDSGEGSNFVKGQGLLIKEGISSSSKYVVRNVHSISTDDLNLSFNTTSAASSGTNLGQAQHYKVADQGHPTFTMHHFQDNSGSAYSEVSAGCRVTSMEMNFAANDFAESTFSVEGIKYYFNPIVITSSNKYVDFDDGGGEENATLTEQVYRSPIEFATEVQSKMDALTTDNITVTYDSDTGKFTIASDGGTLSLLWNTGTNTANTAGAELGFAVAADDTGATSYESDNALDPSPSVTPSYDSSDPVIVRDSELMIGSFDRFICRPATTFSVSVATPKTDQLSMCAENGVASSLINSREVTWSASIALPKYEADLFDKFINNTTTQLAFSCGQKSVGDWQAGTVFNLYLPNVSITGHTVADNAGYRVINLEGNAFVNSTNDDIHINFL